MQRGPQRARAAVVFGYDELVVIHPQHFLEGPHHALVGRHAALEGDGWNEFFADRDVALEVPRHGEAQPGDDVVVRRALLLQVNHVRLGKDTAAPGHSRRMIALQGELAELLDADVQPRGLLVQERAGARRTHGVHHEVADAHVAVVPALKLNHLAVFAADLDNRAHLGVQE